MFQRVRFVCASKEKCIPEETTFMVLLNRGQQAHAYTANCTAIDMAQGNQDV
jgi:hypothetical protein